jgi:hypothetical protein
MTYACSDHSTLQKLGSWCSDGPGCLTARNRSQINLISPIRRIKNALLHGNGPRQYVPIIRPCGNLIVAEDQALRIKPHSVELGRRFSPIHF